ncbi:unnamed protein product [Effrenium voratum]|uniref:Uncharacterized protein n=1 Tax=Effrenium voratum TaxID=2562239 RepID=A0AA36NA65_9DINO|nr:unnamed protein product [Effrenium voratum]CAJ1433389.1 unnamed protein product [Effrenium voratum]
MPRVLQMLSSARAGRPCVLRFQEEEKQGEDVAVMDYSDVSDFWFDWEKLERAEAQARSRSAPPRRSQPASWQASRQEAQEAQAREAVRREREAKAAQAREAWEAAKEAEAKREAAKAEERKGKEIEEASVDAGPRRKRRSRRESGRGRELTDSSESEELTQAESFLAYLERKPPMRPRCDVGSAWDFPLAKSEKRELLLQHIAHGEQMAEEHATEAAAELVRARREERRSRQSFESAKAALTRMRKKGRRRSLGPFT